uniref:ABC1 family protein, related n=1 Tax=Neospora caninum (strain Liverpool) TaxID=572307 RepID=F0JB20_NEOCL|nr:ABC1 family protein, related [Neospora caninum Liverpool]CEL71286.1 TPA: ABC1 family protein, related [Neospora caninum Liverpool]
MSVFSFRQVVSRLPKRRQDGGHGASHSVVSSALCPAAGRKTTRVGASRCRGARTRSWGENEADLRVSSSGLSSGEKPLRPAYSWRNRDTAHEEKEESGRPEDHVLPFRRWAFRWHQRTPSTGHLLPCSGALFPENMPVKAKRKEVERLLSLFSVSETRGLPQRAKNFYHPSSVACPLFGANERTYTTAGTKGKLSRRKGRTMPFSPLEPFSSFLPLCVRAQSRIDPRSPHSARMGEAKFSPRLAPPFPVGMEKPNCRSFCSNRDASWGGPLAFAVAWVAVPQEDEREDAEGRVEGPLVFRQGEVEGDREHEEGWRVRPMMQRKNVPAGTLQEESCRAQNSGRLTPLREDLSNDAVEGGAEATDEQDAEPNLEDRDEEAVRRRTCGSERCARSRTERGPRRHSAQLGDPEANEESKCERTRAAATGDPSHGKDTSSGKRGVKPSRVAGEGVRGDSMLAEGRVVQKRALTGLQPFTGSDAISADYAKPQRGAEKLLASAHARPYARAANENSLAWCRASPPSPSSSISGPFEFETLPVGDCDKRKGEAAASRADESLSPKPSAASNLFGQSRVVAGSAGVSSGPPEPEEGEAAGDRLPREGDGSRGTLGGRMASLALRFQTPRVAAAVDPATPDETDPAGPGALRLRIAQRLTRQLEDLPCATRRLVSWLWPAEPDFVRNARGTLIAWNAGQEPEADAEDAHDETFFRTRATVERFLRSVFYLSIAAADYKITFSRVDRVSRDLNALQEERVCLRERLAATRTPDDEGNAGAFPHLVSSQGNREEADLQSGGDPFPQSGLSRESRPGRGGSLAPGGGCPPAAVSGGSSFAESSPSDAGASLAAGPRRSESEPSWLSSLRSAFVDAPRAPPLEALQARLGTLEEQISDLRERRKQLLAGAHDRCARRLLHVCRRHGGLYTKLGQYVSTMTHIIPSAYTNHLRTLQDDASRTPWPQVVRLVEAELGAPIDDVFLSFDRDAVAAASLAQVHHARLRDGREVAVKVQRPGLREQMCGDLQTVEILMGVVSRVFPDFEFRWLLPEFRQNMRQETDFRQEAYNAMRLRWLFRHEPEVYVPWVHWELTTKRVMTMEFVRGLKVTDPPETLERELGAKPEEVARLVMKVFSDMLFLHGFVHCDPHPGNLFVRRMPEAREGADAPGAPGNTRQRTLLSALRLAASSTVSTDRPFLFSTVEPRSHNVSSYASVRDWRGDAGAPVSPSDTGVFSVEARRHLPSSESDKKRILPEPLSVENLQTSMQRVGERPEGAEGVSGLRSAAESGGKRPAERERADSGLESGWDRNSEGQLAPATLGSSDRGGRRGRVQLVIIDHGTYRRLNPSFRTAYCRLWKALLLNDVGEGRKACRALGVRLPISAGAKPSALLASSESVSRETESGHSEGGNGGEREGVPGETGRARETARCGGRVCETRTDAEGEHASELSTTVSETPRIATQKELCDSRLPGHDTHREGGADTPGAARSAEQVFGPARDASHAPAHTVLAFGRSRGSALGVPDPDEDAALDLLSLILTYRPQTRLLYTALGSAIHAEDRKAMFARLRGASFSAVNAFVESLPRDLLWVMRMTNILRSLNFQLGGSTRSRLLAMGESSCRGLQLSNELVDQMETDCRRFLSRREAASGSARRPGRPARREGSAEDCGESGRQERVSEARGRIATAEEPDTARRPQGPSGSRSTDAEATTENREPAPAPELDRRGGGPVSEPKDAETREAPTPDPLHAGPNTARHDLQAKKKARRTDPEPGGTVGGEEDGDGGMSEGRLNRSVPRWFTLPGAESLNLPLASDVPCFRPAGSVTTVCRVLDIVAGPFIWLAETLTGHRRRKSSSEARDAQRDHRFRELQTEREVPGGLTETALTGKAVGDDPMEMLESQVFACNCMHASRDEANTSSACSPLGDSLSSVSFPSLSPWSAWVARELLKAVLSLQLWWGLQCLRFRLWLADAFLAFAVAQLPAGDLAPERPGDAVLSLGSVNGRASMFDTASVS